MLAATMLGQQGIYSCEFATLSESMVLNFKVIHSDGRIACYVSTFEHEGIHNKYRS